MINNGPEIWSKLLDEAPEGSILMGGAVVDWAFHPDIIPNDFDLWMPYEVGYTPEIAGWHLIKAHGFDHINQYMHDGHHQTTVGSVNTYLRDHPNNPNQVIKIQIMGVMDQDPKSQFSKFDHSLTLGSFSDQGLFVHKMVYDSFNIKTVVCTNGSKPEVSLKRAKKKVKKYCPVTYDEWIFIGFE